MSETQPGNGETNNILNTGEKDDTSKNVKLNWKTILVVAAIVAVIIAILLAVYFGTRGSPETEAGLTFIPGGDITFSPNDPSSYQAYVDHLNDFIKPYEDAKVGGKIIQCRDDKLPKGDEVCIFEADWLDDCSRKNNWGFAKSYPCVLMTYRNDTAFDPKIYDSMADLPSDAPKDLKDVLEISEHENDGELLKVVWVYCTKGVAYAPYQGFYHYYFPNRDLDYYMPPLIGVVFDLEKKENIDVPRGEKDLQSTWNTCRI